jgi:hypothetical protein
MTTQTREISKLKPHPQNPKLHTEEQIERIKNSIKEFGFTQPVVIDENDQILIGHGRTKAAKLAGLLEVPVIIKSGLTEEEKIALCTVDNLLAQETELDPILLAEICRNLKDQEYGLHLLGLHHYDMNFDAGQTGVGDQEEVKVNTIGQIVILMEAKDFDEVQRKFDSMRAKRPQLKDNTQVFLTLLENYENLAT